MHLTYTNSELSSVTHSGNPTLRAALDANPEIASTRARLAAFRAAVAAVEDEPSEARRARLTDDFRQAVDGGEPIPRRLLDDIADTTAGDRDRMVISEFLRNLDAEYVQAADDAIRNGVNGLYAHLHEQLTAALTTGRAACQAGAVSAEVALRSGVGDQWVALSDARATYVQVLSAQVLIETKVEQVERDTRHLALAHIANAAEVWPDLPRWARYGYAEDAHGNKKHLSLPWPDVKKDRPDLFDWLITHPTAQGWVPTVKQRQAARLALGQAEDDLGPRQGPRARAGAKRYPPRAPQAYELGALTGVIG
ncbi:MAG: hypothetical protein BWY91_00362 [bacterium ADurb.BinA028]|jgi:hypothetical protein|nr:MAG: hypothetical protein BWY91_00362 [bacterium ADurb.BinA028]